MGIDDKIEVWLFSIALKKGVKAAATFIVSAVVGFTTSAAIAPWLNQMGVTIDPAQLKEGLALLLTTAGTALLTMILNYIKVKSKPSSKII